MKRLLLSVVALLGLAEFGSAQAQIVYGAGFSFTVRGHRGRASGFVGGYTIRPVYPPYGGMYFAPGFGPGWNPVSGNPYFLPPPGGLAPPPWGPPVFGPPWYFLPPVIVVPPPVIVVGNPNGNAGVIPAAAVAPPRDPPRQNPEAGPLGAKPGQFIVISPKRDALPVAANPKIPDGTSAPPIEKVQIAEPQRLPRFDPFAGPLSGRVEQPEPDPDREYARLMALARAAFINEEYGRAIDIFDRAAKTQPHEALPHVLKAQAFLACGQYIAAVNAIRAGMKLNPNWPASDFRPRELYGLNPERFDVQLAALRTTLAENPGDARLQFLLGCELWFSGNRADALEFFRAAKSEPLSAAFLNAAAKP